jgi:hypothetical protein
MKSNRTLAAIPCILIAFASVSSSARAAEKEVPPKVRSGGAVKNDLSEPSDQKKPPMKDGKREGGNPSAERDGGTKKPGTRDGEGSVKKPGDGEKPRSGMKDNEKPRTGVRDGDKPRTGERDGMKKPGGERDGQGQKPRKGSEGSADTPVHSSSEVITMHVTAAGDTVLINGEKHPTSGLRGFLSSYLPEHPGAKVIVSGDPDTPLKSLHQIVDAIRDNGNKNVAIKAE